MARNFSSHRIKKEHAWRQSILPVALFLLVFGLFFWGLAGVDSTTQEEKLHGVERAITKAVVQCYAVEGQYPASISYLRENYGLSVDEKQYIIHMDFLGGNIMPQITVMPRYFGDE